MPENVKVGQNENVPWTVLIRPDQFYTTAMYVERAMQKEFNVASIRVNAWGWLDCVRAYSPRNIVHMLDKMWRFKYATSNIEPDLILVIDPVRRAFDFSRINAPTAYYAIDSHVNFDSHIKDARVQEYDYLFVAQKDWIPNYREHGCERVYWLPGACDPEIHKHYDLPLIYDVCFVGNPWEGMSEKALRAFPYIKPRAQLISKLKKEFNMFVGRRYLHDMAKVFSQSKIVFNKSLRGDLNQRVFETLSCGRLLLTDRVSNGLEEMFTDKKHLVIYDEWDDLVKKIRYYLDNSSEREQIAKNGQKEVHQKHTYTHRVRYLVNTVLR